MIKEIELANIEEKMNIVDYLTGQLGLSTRKSKALIKERKVAVNGKTGYRDSRLKNGDRLVIDFSEDEEDMIVPQEMPLEVIYEDDCLLAVNKPAFMLVHPTKNHPDGTLANGIAHHFRLAGVRTQVRLLNRLDMNTSGIVLVPKSGEIHSSLGKRMTEDLITKEYLSLVVGCVEPDQGRIELPLGADPQEPFKRAVIKDGQAALTEYKTIKCFGSVSLLRLKLLTGRTHQIRVHLSHIGHPIVGDTLYGSASTQIGRQALHACEMTLNHPVTEALLVLKAKMPEDMEKMIDLLENGGKFEA